MAFTETTDSNFNCAPFEDPFAMLSNQYQRHLGP